jgi:hypothetical protein
VSQQINLFNPIFRQQKKYFSSVTMLQALAIICLACVLLVADGVRRTRALQAQASATSALLAARQQKLTDFRVQYPARQKSPTLGAEIMAAQDELSMLSNAAATITRGGFGDTRGFSDYFRAFARQSVDGLWLTGLEIGANGTQLGVQGNTLQPELVPVYMRRLGTEPVMQGKSFSQLQIGTPLASPAGAAAAVPANVKYLSFNLQSAGGAAAPAVVAK